MNPDHALLLDFLRSPGGPPRAVDSNPLALALGTTLIAADAAAGTLTLGFEPDARFVQGNGAVQGATTSRQKLACCIIGRTKARRCFGRRAD